MRGLGIIWIFITLCLSGVCVRAQQACSTGFKVEGQVADASGAVIPDAAVTTPEGDATTTSASGTFTFWCLQYRPHSVTVRADGFADRTTSFSPTRNRTISLRISLDIAEVNTSVTVGADSGEESNALGSRTLGAAQISTLADDPDELLQQLQDLAAAGGGTPGAATITVDGFQAPTRLPPKSSIASIRINPDMFSGQYEQAPYLGGRIEIFTKPGADRIHGALVFADSDSSFNANDPYSVSGTPASRRRYGFDLSGPIRRDKSGFAMALEKRDINEFSVINAIGLDQDLNQVALHQSIATPQTLWTSFFRSDWQFGTKNVTTVSLNADVNDMENQGVGGLTFVSAGASGHISEYDLRLSNVFTMSPTTLNQTRIGYSWNRTDLNPNSTAPALQVAGYFVGGGATAQHSNNRERDLEVDDEFTMIRSKHTIGFGVQSYGSFVHNFDPDTFNGSYIFGGGTAPQLDAAGHPTGATITINALEQYRRAMANLPGGTPTSYQIGMGTALIPFSQWKMSLFSQDSIKVSPRITLLGALRYQFQTSPTSSGNFSPRLGISWALDAKSNWVLHARIGIFREPIPLAYTTEVYRLNGTRQTQATVYSPLFGNPLVPVPGSIAVGRINVFPHRLIQPSSLQTHIRIERKLPKGWHAMATLFWAENWGSTRLTNINAPEVASSDNTPPDPIAALTAPRPSTPNLNIMQYQNSGHLAGDIIVAGADKSNGKKFSLSVYYVYNGIKTDSGETLMTPQSTYSEKGEEARRDGESTHAVYASATLHLPFKVDLSTILAALGGQPFNITSGTDSNGDGTFNDRPSFAIATSGNRYQTPYGAMTTDVINGNVPRNTGTMTARLHLDANLTRTFTLNPRDKAHPRTLQFNVRSANLANHTNVTAFGSVLPAANFNEPISAEAARRIEMGVRFAF